MGIVDWTNNKGTYHNYLRKAVPGLYTKGNGSMQEEQRNRYLDSIQMENAKKLGKARVAVFGRGCVGSYTAETLVKSGIGTVELIDRKQAENLLRAYPPPILEYDYIVDTMDVPEDKIALIILAKVSYTCNQLHGYGKMRESLRIPGRGYIQHTSGRICKGAVRYAV